MSLKLGVEVTIEFLLAEEAAQTRGESAEPVYLRLLPYRREGVP
jgi:hypothetical protein